MGHMEQQPQPSATLGKKHVQFAHNPVSATINRPESSESETESFRSNAQGPHEPMKLFVTLTGDAAGKVADENQLEAIPSIIEIRLSDWAREEFSENLRMIFVADENGAGAVWKFKKSVTDPFSFVYWFEGKGEPVKYSANLPERKSSFLR
ncbi:hypothetical protein FB446DRAFT_713812 [Lentinula raphanica]|nr:hypothetical protein FB446DRAFT_713812 [Lentinula raphanica]